MDKVICLGIEFNSEDERREHYRKELRTKLPELKKIEGFPIGEDEDIINLSDPPYYTACPNPWLNDFITQWEKEKENIKGRNPDFHVEEPYTSDISEGKNNPIYNAHSYHTKVPHPAIMRYILHYTQPGDIVLDGFAGTGMTGVAAQLCGNPDEETKYKIEQEFKKTNSDFAWGSRKSICGDLSPIASFIAYNYNCPIDVIEFEKKAKEVANDVNNQWGWMFETKDKFGNIGSINFTIWSDVFICPNCNGEIIFYNVGVDHELREVRDNFRCPHCNADQTKKTVERAKTSVFDSRLNSVIKQDKIVPVLINYTKSGKRQEKIPDKNDLKLIETIKEVDFGYWTPIDQIPIGDKTSDPLNKGISHVHHFHIISNLIALSAFWAKTGNDRIGNGLKLAASAANPNISKMRRFRPDGKGGGPLAGTLYVASIITPQNCVTSILRNVAFVQKAFNQLILFEFNNSATYTSSCSHLNQNDNSVDYIFTDPPFGANLMYSELNFMWESWLKIKTDNEHEAIENKTQKKNQLFYQNLMTRCFKEYFRVLKPGKWMTVEFSNTSAAVWNGIQTSLQRAGFIVANVAALDKKQGSFNAVSNPTSVKQDLVISCYKPSIEFENKITSFHGDVLMWDFVNEHLHHLPVHIKKENNTTAIIERSPKVLFDRLITFHLMRSLPVPIDARDFQEGLKQRFIERDGMYFTAEQAAEYDEKKAKAPHFVQLSLLVTSEGEGIDWLRNELKKPQTAADLHPKWLQAIAALRKNDILPELRDLLEQNFIKDSDGKWHIPDLSQAKVREAMRSKILLKEFNEYVTAISQPRAKKLKEVRVEALRAGFKNCWEQKDFNTIVTLGDMIPQNILLEDEQLLMYYDIAKDRV